MLVGINRSIFIVIHKKRLSTNIRTEFLLGQFLPRTYAVNLNETVLKQWFFCEIFKMSCKHRKSRKSNKSRSRSQSSSSNYTISTDTQTSEDEPKFEIKISKVMGRYMVSKFDIVPGEVILSELPIVVGPCTDSKVQCLGCYKNLENEDSFVRCKGCRWLLCSYSCPGLKQPLGHTTIECTILQETKSATFFDRCEFSNMRAHFQAIVPLRCLLLKTTDPSTYAILMDMEHHNSIRKNIPDVWNGNQVNVVNRIIKDWGLTEYTEDEVHTICGVLEVNCFQIGQHGVYIRGLYPTAFLMSHDCIPNTNHVDEEINYRLTVRASIRISTGHPITLSYAYTLQNTIKRREHLLDNKFFECYCRRCTDPAELGSYTGALLCPKCKTGLVLCDKPADQESTWSCTSTNGKCPGYTITSRSMRLLLNRISQEVDQINCNDVTAMEAFLNKYRNVLHPTHYLYLGTKISLSQLYGKVSGFLIYELSDEMLQRKQNICQEILKVFDIIEPGYTRIRGVTLYEIHAPLMILLQRQLADKSVSKVELKTRLKEIVRILIEASIILSYEPENSAEGIMGKAAKEALVQIRAWEKIVGKIC